MASIVDISALFKNRIGWKDDGTADGFILSANASLSESGRFFQDAHPAVTLLNIKSVQSVKTITTEQYNLFLEDFKRVVVERVVSDVYDGDYIPGNIHSAFPQALDKAIMLMGVIKTSEYIMTSVNRTNNVEKFSKDFISKLHYDIFREAPNKFAIRGANYAHALGITTQYSIEIESLQRRLGKPKNSLDSATAGQAINRK